MSYHRISVIPDENDLTGYLGVKGNLDRPDGIPSIVVAEGITIQFQPKDHEFAVRYLTKLADEARALAAKVAEAQS